MVMAWPPQGLLVRKQDQDAQQKMMTAAAGRGEAAERWPVSATFSVAYRLCLCPVHPRLTKGEGGPPSERDGQVEVSTPPCSACLSLLAHTHTLDRPAE